jgi:ubiquinone biosynthesis monooxygenase Coq7
VRAELEQAAREETDHLAWCEQRINELGGRKSLLNPLWFGGASNRGGWIARDKWNSGFAETERQVEAHLDGPASRWRLTPKAAPNVEMKIDEIGHAQVAHDGGVAAAPVKLAGAADDAADGSRVC